MTSLTPPPPSIEDNQKQNQKRCCISHEFFYAATKRRHKTAVIHAPPPLHGGGAASYSTCSAAAVERRFTYDDVLRSVDSLSSRISSLLCESECEKRMPVFNEAKEREPRICGVYMQPSVEYVVAVLSVLRCGEAFLPLDPSWPKDRVLSIAKASRVEAIVASQSLFRSSSYNESNDDLDWFEECNGDSGSSRVLWFSMEKNVEECGDISHAVWPCEREDSRRSFCYLMYTSGSTGKPKGVCGTEEGLLNRFLWMQELYPFDEEEVLLFKTSISFIDHLQEFLGAMLSGCTLVIPPPDVLKENPSSIVDFLQAYSINRLTAVPSLIRAILPDLKSRVNQRIESSLKVLVLSGEAFPLSMWDELSKLLSRTSILNLYGSTEVSGDCTYFDCKKLPMILGTEELTSVPIGVPIANCNVALVGETDASNEGEIYVSGLCVSKGYFRDSAVLSSDYLKLHNRIAHTGFIDEWDNEIYFKTGDFARRLQCGDLVFSGRKDRTLKVNGQRIALEEIEDTLRTHLDVVDAAVIPHEYDGDLFLLEAFLLLKDKDKCGDSFVSSVRSWMVDKFPLAMIPRHFVVTESLPMSSSGKIDYALLSSSSPFSRQAVQEEIGKLEGIDLLQVIKKAFCDALAVEDVYDDDDFFKIGGNSIAAAHASYNLGIDMRMLYEFPTPSKLRTVLLAKNEYNRTDANGILNLKAANSNIQYSTDSASLYHSSLSSPDWQLKNFQQKDIAVTTVSKRLKIGPAESISPEYESLADGHSWPPTVASLCAISRCNKVIYEGGYRLSHVQQSILSMTVPINRKCSLHELWKVHMQSCVDASPLLVFRQEDVYLFIGSHSHKFMCINAQSGFIQWEVILEGRIESTAAITGDFSQVVVGSYSGGVYFIDFFVGKICWKFQTHGEVKCQPVMDAQRQLVWCGSHDHNIYALDYKNHCCVYKLPCGGSVFGSPVIDKGRDRLYVASTSGCLTCILIKALPFDTLWRNELKVPVFGSLVVGSEDGKVICCLVDGNVVALDFSGSIIWRCRTGGPIFAGACISSMLPSQVLICSRNGVMYSFGMENGDLLWEYNVGDPITSSTYIDEHLQLVSEDSLRSDRLVCLCTSSGSIHLLRINLDVAKTMNQTRKDMVQEFSRLELSGDIFSSPVMVGGRIFVGCRDDYVHCITVKT